MTSDVRAALEAGDDGFHEIQLNGKQLVFLGMATTLVSVVIFLCGVLVGRGVKPLDAVAQAGGPQAFDAPAASPVAPGAIATPAPAPPTPPAPTASAAGAAAEAAGDTEPTPQGDEPEEPVVPAAAPAPAPAAVAPAPRPAPKPSEPPKRAPAEVKPTPKPEPARAAAVPPAVTPPPPPTAKPAAPPAVTPAPAPTAVATTAPAASSGKIAVQVGAFKTRNEADALARRLSGRGYAVYVMNPTDDGKAVFRVRVGNYASADEAQRVSAKLTSQEKLKPWIIR
jgi:cell division septation protein DedD